MSSKRRCLIGGCIFLVIGLTVTKIIIRESNFFQKREKANSYCINNIDTDADKDDLYHQYVIETLVETIEKENGVKDCKIDVTYSNGEIDSAIVSIVAENVENDMFGKNILNVVSQSLEISTEDIVLSYD